MNKKLVIGGIMAIMLLSVGCFSGCIDVGAAVGKQLGEKKTYVGYISQGGMFTGYDGNLDYNGHDSAISNLLGTGKYKYIERYNIAIQSGAKYHILNTCESDYKLIEDIHGYGELTLKENNGIFYYVSHKIMDDKDKNKPTYKTYKDIVVIDITTTGMKAVNQTTNKTNFFDIDKNHCKNEGKIINVILGDIIDIEHKIKKHWTIVGNIDPRCKSHIVKLDEITYVYKQTITIVGHLDDISRWGVK